MKNLIFLALFLSPFSFILAQKIEPTNHSETVSTLKYAPEIPSSNTYIVKVNNSGKEVPVEILEQLNFYRKGDIDFLWKVDEDLEILIYSLHKISSEQTITD
jgi:hypothetical protein